MKMKKRMIRMISVLMILLMMGTCFVYADDVEEPVVGEGDLDYVVVNSAETRLAMSGNKAVCKVTLYVDSASNANKVVLTVNYMKASGVSVGTKSVTVYRSNDSFVGRTTKELTSHGTYYAKVTVKVYYNSQLIESFNVTSQNVVY